MNTATQTVEPVQVIQTLNRLSGGLEQLGVELANIETELEPVQKAHDTFVEDFKAGLWEQHLAGELKRMPAEDVRLALAYKQMPTTLRGKFAGLKQRRERCLNAISRTRAQIEANRSILSALKEGIV